MRRFFNLNRQGIHLPYERLGQILKIGVNDELSSTLKEMMTLIYREARLCAGFLYLEDKVYEYRYLSQNISDILDEFLSAGEYTRAYILDTCMNVALMISQDEDQKKLKQILEDKNQEIAQKKEYPKDLSYEELKLILNKLSFYHQNDLKMNELGVLIPVKAMVFAYELGKAGCISPLQEGHQCQLCYKKNSCEYRKEGRKDGFV